MKKKLFWLATACFAVLQSCKQDTQVSPQQQIAEKSNLTVNAGTFANPVIGPAQNPKDPQIFKANGKIWLIHPSGSNAYTLYSSTNMVSWTLETTNVFSLSSGQTWSAGTYVYTSSGTTHYNLYYTRVYGSDSKNRTIGVASATSPAGPYTDQTSYLINKTNGSGVQIPCIDPAVFKDPISNKVYMYYSQGVGDPGNPTLRCVQLASNGLTTVAGTDQQVLTITQDWENINIEHPLVYYAPNAAASHRYYMLYNGSGGALARYAIGYAYSSSPTGPFTKATAGTGTGQNPLVAQIPAQGIYGPGAPNTIVDDAGTRWLLYRIKTTAGESWSDRAICIDVLDRNGSDQLICTPTKGTQQAKPVFN